MIDPNLLSIFLDVIKIEGLSTQEKNVAIHIRNFLSQFPVTIHEDDSYKFTKSNTGNLICKIGDGGDMLLMSHMDTARSTKDVKPIILEDRITSDGTTVLGVDNRAGIAVLLFLINKIFTEKIPIKNFTVAFSTCEETTLYGSKYLGINGNIKRAFIFDSGYRPGNFIYSACGAIGFKIEIIGKASHSGIAPEKGINSLSIAAKAISQLPLGRIDEETTMNIGILKSGSAVNVIPELTTLEGEVRSFDIEKAEKYFGLVKNIFSEEVKKYNAEIKLNYDWDFKPYTISKESQVYKEVENSIKKVGLNLSPQISLGGSDANSLNSRGFESINIGIGAQNPHSNDEFIFLEDLENAAKIALELVRSE